MVVVYYCNGVIERLLGIALVHATFMLRLFFDAALRLLLFIHHRSLSFRGVKKKHFSF